MNFWALVSAEWMKAWRRPMHRVLAVLIGGIGLLFTLFMAIRWAAGSNPDMVREGVAWPRLLLLTAGMLQAMGRIAAVLLAASIFGGEYSLDTWKMLLPRRERRGGLVAAKMAVALAATLIIGALVVAGFVGGGRALAIFTGAPAAPSTTGDLSVIVRGMLCFPIAAALYVALSGCATVVSRSMFGGILVGLAFLIVIDHAVSADPVLALSFPAYHLANLQALLSGDAGQLDEVQMVFEAEVPLWASAAVVLGYISALLAASLAVFGRRDLAGSTGG